MTKHNELRGLTRSEVSDELAHGSCCVLTSADAHVTLFVGTFPIMFQSGSCSHPDLCDCVWEFTAPDGLVAPLAIRVEPNEGFDVLILPEKGSGGTLFTLWTPK